MNSSTPSSDAPRLFPRTRWSLVLAATQRDSTESAVALEAVCSAYWQPLYAYVRRRGYSTEDAQDLTQEFFARLLAKDYLQNLRHQQGKFRSFLLAYLKNFLLEQRRKVRALKRGGGQVFVSLDTTETEDG